MATEREVAGIRCMQVLERLSEYVDGELSAPAAEQIEAHLRGCDYCERFGGRFSAMIAALRAELARPEDVSEGISRRLLARLDEEAE
jgi:anti-sigma factor RsiW